jgi:Flp pilus assembly protein TadG
VRLNYFKNRKGQSLVETALVLPVLLLILTGIIDFSLMFNNYLIVSNASREGARCAIVGSTNEQITTAVNTVAQTLDSTKLTITITPSDKADRVAGTSIKVSIKYTYKMITPVISAILPSPFNLSAYTTMRCE